MIDTDPAFEDGDGFYAELVKACEALTDEAATRFLARLCLVLANQVGDDARLRDAIAAAAEGLPKRADA